MNILKKIISSILKYILKNKILKIHSNNNENNPYLLLKSISNYYNTT